MAKRELPAYHKPKHDPATSDHDWGQRYYAMLVLDVEKQKSDLALFVTLPRVQEGHDRMAIRGAYGLLEWLRLPLP